MNTNKATNESKNMMQQTTIPNIPIFKKMSIREVLCTIVLATVVDPVACRMVNNIN